ncbi:hypothetical protein ABZ687_13385 [Streptomyces ardesiacus]|uniref:hypothetical protein n=1 Tax=Streptomyces TaxID=1883 RepID=UPI00131C9423|nr:hypothetical protein [Streptomyces sp. NRRL F-7442]
MRSAAIALQVPPRRRAQHTGLKRCASPRLGGLGDATTKATVSWWPEWAAALLSPGRRILTP